MGENGAPFGGGSGFHFRPAGGGRGGAPHMSAEDAEAFFSQFFGSSDPFGGMGGPGMSFSFGGGGPRGSRGGMADPFSMFGGIPTGGSVRGSAGMPGSMGGMGGMPGGMSGFGGIPSRRKRYDAIPSGTIVSLKGLQNRPERNGDRGQIVDYDPAAGRYTVVVEDTDEALRVKPSNLLQHIHVRLESLGGLPELNGKQGTIIAWNEHKERYNVYVMDKSKVYSLKPANIILENGTVGQIVNLQSKPHLNGNFGTITTYHSDSHRYDVQLSADQIIRVKVENIRV